MSSSMEQDRMMGGIRDAIYKNDTVPGMYGFVIRIGQVQENRKMQTRIFYKKRSCGTGTTIQIR